MAENKIIDLVVNTNAELELLPELTVLEKVNNDIVDTLTELTPEELLESITDYFDRNFEKIDNYLDCLGLKPINMRMDEKRRKDFGKFLLTKSIDYGRKKRQDQSESMEGDA